MTLLIRFWWWRCHKMACWYLYIYKYMIWYNDTLDFTMMVLKQGWSLIDFDDTKTLLIYLLIMLLSVLEMYLIPEAKNSLRILKIQHLEDGFESLLDRIQISISKSEENWNREGWFESFYQRFESLWKKKL